jgi:hypothetical protein
MQALEAFSRLVKTEKSFDKPASVLSKTFKLLGLVLASLFVAFVAMTAQGTWNPLPVKSSYIHSTITVTTFSVVPTHTPWIWQEEDVCRNKVIVQQANQTASSDEEGHFDFANSVLMAGQKPFKYEQCGLVNVFCWVRVRQCIPSSLLFQY